MPDQTPAPGIYPGVPNDTYHRVWDAASNSRLTKLRRSPAHMRAYIENPPEDTAALIMGRAIHTAILEPDDFTSRYGACPEGLDRRTKEGKAIYADLQLQFGPGYLLKHADYEIALKVRDAVAAHPKARAIQSAERQVEVSLRFDDVATGVRCKVRPDCYTPGVLGGTLWDIKTTRDASFDAFQRTVFGLGYFRQGALYLDGSRAVDLPAERFAFIAVEKVLPFAVAVYELEPEAIDAGRRELRPLLAQYKRCEDERYYGGYNNDEIRYIGLPKYAYSQLLESEFAFGDEEVAA